MTSRLPTRNWVESKSTIAWVLLFFCFAPTLVDYGNHLVSNSFTWYVFAFIPLAIIAIRNQPRRPPKVGPALILAMIGMVLLGWALVSTRMALGRVAFVLTALGLLLLEGRSDLRSAALLALCIPLPSVVLTRLSDPQLLIPGSILAGISRLSGVPVSVDLASETLLHRHFVLDESDIGWTAGILAFGICMLARPNRVAPHARVLAESMIWGAIAMLLHTFMTVVCFRLVDPASLSAARIVRDVLVFGSVVIASAALLASSRPRPTQRSAASQPPP